MKLALFLLWLSGCLLLASGFAQVAAAFARIGDAHTANIVGYSGLVLAAIVLAIGAFRIVRS